MLGDGLLQLFLMLFVIFFLSRRRSPFSKIFGTLNAHERQHRCRSSRHYRQHNPQTVVFGIVGSAAGQGVVALIGFWIAGVPGAITLGVAVFVLSAVPIGPPLVWGPAAFCSITKAKSAWRSSSCFGVRLQSPVWITSCRS